MARVGGKETLDLPIHEYAYRLKRSMVIHNWFFLRPTNWILERVYLQIRAVCAQRKQGGTTVSTIVIVAF